MNLFLDVAPIDTRPNVHPNVILSHRSVIFFQQSSCKCWMTRMVSIVTGGRLRRMFRKRKESVFALKGHQCLGALCLTAKALRSISEVFKKEVKQARRYKEQQPHQQLASGFLTVLSLKQSSMKSILCTFPFFRLLCDPVPRIVPDEPFITVL